MHIVIQRKGFGVRGRWDKEGGREEKLQRPGEAPSTYPSMLASHKPRDKIENYAREMTS